MPNGARSVGLDLAEDDLRRSLENDATPLVSVMTPELRAEIVNAATATVGSERAHIELDVPRYELERLKSKAKAQGLSYETVIKGLISAYVSS